jgi:outer membrane protein assembly factor BamB
MTGCSTEKNKAIKEELKIEKKEKIVNNEETKKDEEDNNISYFKQHEVVDNKEAKADFILEAYDRDENIIWDKKWKNLYITELELASKPIIKNEFVYIEVYGDLYSIDLKTGKEIWISKGIGASSKSYIDKDRIYITGYYGPFLTCIERKTGKQIWQYDNGDMFWSTSVSKIDDKIVVEYDSAEGAKKALFSEGGVFIGEEKGY